MQIRIHAHGDVPLASPGKLRLTDAFTTIDTDALDEETAAAIRNFRARHIIAPHPSDLEAFEAWMSGTPNMAAPPAVTASAAPVVDELATTKEERPSRKR